jgi:hypothetical protein
MIDTRLLIAAGVTPTYDPDKDQDLFFLAMEKTETRIAVNSALAVISKPFSRFFHYGTNIGEAFEEVVGKRFTEIIPKNLPDYNKKGKRIKDKKNPIYTSYYKKHNLKPSNFDWLFYGSDGKIYRLEVKVIRAIESKEKADDGEKLYQIQTPQWERALTFAQGSGGNGTFQQTKPEFCDYVMGIVIYADQVDFYIVPSTEINKEENIIQATEVDPKSGKKSKGITGHLILKPQHGKAEKNSNGTYKEGHLVLAQLDSYKKISVYNEKDLLTSDSLTKYIYDSNI